MLESFDLTSLVAGLFGGALFSRLTVEYFKHRWSVSRGIVKRSADQSQEVFFEDGLKQCRDFAYKIESAYSHSSTNLCNRFDEIHKSFNLSSIGNIKSIMVNINSLFELHRVTRDIQNNQLTQAQRLLFENSLPKVIAELDYWLVIMSRDPVVGKRKFKVFLFRQKYRIKMILNKR